MPKTNGIGHSARATASKQIGLRDILSQHISICRSVITKHSHYANPHYVYIDSYCGDGGTYEGLPGSPVIFHELMQEEELLCQAFFIDTNETNISNLKPRLSPAPGFSTYTFLEGRCQIHVPEICMRHINKRTYGLLYCDPNGLPDAEMLTDVSRRAPKLDILIRFNATASKRIDNGSRIQDLIKRVGKENWIIHGPAPSDFWQWVFIFGTNYTDYKGWKSKGFHNIDSDGGRIILHQVNHTKAEKISNPVPYIEPKSPIVDAAGICPECGNFDELVPFSITIDPPKIISICKSCFASHERKRNAKRKN